ncbi:MAG: transcriptional regulator [Gammaproteobacteria bacterium]|nr:MAG: transcriptional regulator [Gammaproteobacteria bacterium]
MPEKKYTTDQFKCPITYCMSKIGGKYKPIILFLILLGYNRFGIILKNTDKISKQTLANKLQELVNDGIIEKKIYPEVPPKVLYNISDYGKTLLPILEQMKKWGQNHIE